MTLDPPPQTTGPFDWIWRKWFNNVYIWILRAVGERSAVTATTSGTSHDITVPLWATKVTITGAGVSTNGTSLPQFQLGDSSGVETSGYLSAASLIGSSLFHTNSTAGFALYGANAANVIHFRFTFYLHDESSNEWVCEGIDGFSSSATTGVSGGSKSLSDKLTTVRLTTVNGTDTFDAGSISARFE